VFHLYPVQIDADVFGRNKEDFVYDMLHERGVKVGTHYIPLHWTTGGFRSAGSTRGSSPVADAVAERIVTLPSTRGRHREALDYLIDKRESDETIRTTGINK